ncbi:MAG: ribosome silencing factor [Chloroflexi bacterium]|nr:MAG: ribosome silencing factor [Chloroflexota bacterium]
MSLARRIVDLASDKQASDIVLLDIRGVSLIADYFVISTAGNERQAAAILKDLSEKLLDEFGRKPLHTEGKPDSGWVLLDYGDVIVHVFSPTQRAFYNLEQLWAAATMTEADSIGRPQVFGAGVSLGMLAGILIGSLVTLWLGEAAIDLIHRMLDRLSGKRERVNFELLLQ